MSNENQKKYRSRVKSLLYLVKLTRSDLSNNVRELSKCMDGANESLMKTLLKTIKYVEAIKDCKLLMKVGEGPLDNWELQAYSNLDYAGDSENRKSVSGYIIYLNGCPIT